MGDKDERIETLRARKAEIEGRVSAVELEARDAGNAPRDGQSAQELGERDRQVADLSTERGNLQQELARASGELEELERGADAEPAPGEGARAAGRQATVPDSPPPGTGPPGTADPPTPGQPAPGSQATEVAREQAGPNTPTAAGSTQAPAQPGAPERPGQEWLLHQARPAQGFGPFEAAQPGDVPWESTTSPRPFLRTVADAERLRSEAQLHEQQMGELNTLRSQLEQHWAPAEQAIDALAANQDTTAEKLAVYREGYRNEFENAARQLNDLWNTHTTETQALQANTLVRAEDQLLPQSDQREDRAMAMASAYHDTAQSLCNAQAITQVRISHVEYVNAYAELESDASKVQAYRESLQASFSNDVEQRIEPLMTQHFPGISQEGRRVSMAADPPSMAQPAGPDAPGPGGTPGGDSAGMPALPGPGDHGRGGP